MKDGILTWNVDPELFTIAGTFPLRYYGLLFMTGVLVALQIEKYIYKREKIPLEQLDKLFVYVIVGIVLGARLGHCLFYEPEYYLKNLLEILLPIRKVGGVYQFTGFQGLASHGATVGVLAALGLYCRKFKTNFLWVLDRVAVVGPVVAAFIRLGNLMNSEIYGKPTNGEWGVVFERVDLIPRHPTQLYEAFAYLIIFGILFYLYKKKPIKAGNGLLLGFCLALIFIARFIIEFFKENQVDFEQGMALNMGQWLSIPFVAVGLILIAYSIYFNKKTA